MNHLLAQHDQLDKDNQRARSTGVNASRLPLKQRLARFATDAVTDTSAQAAFRFWDAIVFVDNPEALARHINPHDHLVAAYFLLSLQQVQSGMDIWAYRQAGFMTNTPRAFSEIQRPSQLPIDVYGNVLHINGLALVPFSYIIVPDRALTKHHTQGVVWRFSELPVTGRYARLQAADKIRAFRHQPGNGCQRVVGVHECGQAPELLVQEGRASPSALYLVGPPL